MLYRKIRTKLRAKCLWILILVGFAIMEFPGVFFINRIDPLVLGMPFIYGFMLVIWLYMCILLFFAYKMHWGKAPNRDCSEENQENMKGDACE